METPPKRFSPRELVRLVYAPTLLHAAGYGMLAPAIPLYAQELDVPFGWIGLLVAVQGLGAIASDVPAGVLVSRVGGRVGMSIGMLASGLGAVALGFGDTPLQLFAAVPLVGVGIATWGTSRLAYVANAAPVEQRGRALALVGGASRVGMMIGPIIGGLLGQQLGLRAAFFGHAVMVLVALALIASHGRETVDPPPEPGESAHIRLLRTVVDNRQQFARAGSVAVSLVMVRSATHVLIPLWGASLGLDLAEIGLVIGLASAVDMTLFYPVGMIMDRWGRKWTIVPCLVVISVSLALVPFTRGFFPFLFVAMLGGFGNGLGSGAVMTMGADLAPREHSGEFLGVWRLIADTGGVFSPAIVGALAQALTLAAAFLCSAVIGLVGAALMVLVVPEGLQRKAAEKEARDSRP